MQPLKSPWFWFFLLILLYSVWDYYDHVSRAGSTFERYPWSWLAFTLFMIVGDILFIFLVNKGLNRIFRREKDHLLIQLLAVAGGAFAHVTFLGSIAANLFWSFSGAGMLTFDSPAAPIALACSIFLTIRFLHFIIIKILKIA